MNDYTPTTEEVRIKYRLSSGRQPGDFAEFNRWLAAHDAEKRAEWEAEQGDKPAPCVMTHTPPFDFAQCETHDETFPLGGACKWHGKESVAQVLQDEADEQRARAVHAEHQLEMLRAEQGETEWEYGVSREVATPMSSREAAERQIELMAKKPNGYRLTANLVRRRVAPWLPVPDTTNNESEGKA